MPRVSVIMASYNHERFVGQAIQSVLDQTFSDFELIITDDASPDKTLDVIRSFDDPRISFEQFERNRQDSARNRCLARASGEYIAILNSDDEFHPQKLQKQVEWLDAHPETGTVFTQVEMISETGETHPDYRSGSGFASHNRTRHEWLRYFFDQGCCLCSVSSMARRDILEQTGPFDPLMVQFPDLDLWVRVCLRAELHILPDVLTRMRLMDAAANISGHRPDTIRRKLHEYYHVLAHYRSDIAIPQLGAVFPELAAAIQDRPACVAAYELARFSMAQPSWHHQMFGAELARDLLSDADRRAEIAANSTLEPIADYFRQIGELSLAANEVERPVEVHQIGSLDADVGRKSATLIPTDHRQIVRLSCQSQVGEPLKLRIDPGNQPGIVSIHSVTLRDRDSRELVRELSGKDLRRSAQIAGTACPLPRRGQLRLLSTGVDPQVHLDPISTGSADMLDVEVDIKISTDLSPVHRRLARLDSLCQTIQRRAATVSHRIRRWFRKPE